jgi:hypothetical protein
MPRTCTVCLSARCGEVDQLLVAGEPLRHLAQRFGLSVSALCRHHKAHVPATLAKARDAAEIVRADSLLQQVRDLQDRAMDILGASESTGALRTASGAIGQARACLELQARLLGELDDATRLQVVVGQSVTTADNTSASAKEAEATALLDWIDVPELNEMRDAIKTVGRLQTIARERRDAGEPKFGNGPGERRVSYAYDQDD